ncbi:hypothetical protein ACSCB1_02945 [Streptomyces europaeiscabiei]|uniref:hypothetical protein n=1 Tax=Streptomyces europaeiscabiei TaxID=146819 RepID=UPI0006285F5B|nr:hypothetical protein [Streptomyces europaeiscabiei]
MPTFLQPQSGGDHRVRAGPTDKKLHREMVVAPSRPMPYGAYVRSCVVGFQVIGESEDEVSAWVLARVTMKAEVSAKESASYPRSPVAALWEDGDWRLSVLRANAPCSRSRASRGRRWSPP